MKSLLKFLAALIVTASTFMVGIFCMVEIGTVSFIAILIPPLFAFVGFALINWILKLVKFKFVLAGMSLYWLVAGIIALSSYILFSFM